MYEIKKRMATTMSTTKLS